MADRKFEYIEEALYNIPLFGKKVGLRNITRMMELLEEAVHLEEYLNRAKIIHVTGTNGKGSVCHMLSNIYSRSGYSVGMFTSPHMEHITERVRINGENVREALFIEGYNVVREIVDRLNEEGLEPTFFEWIYGIALYCFCKEMPDILLIEVGIGGKLDTTNSLPRKDCCIITPVGLDHQEILGNDIRDIAYEKAGIIKEGVPVVLYNENREVEQVVETVAGDIGADLVNVLPITEKILDLSPFGIDFSIQNKYYYYEKLRISTGAVYQVGNAAIALTAVAVMSKVLPVDFESISSGLMSFQWPGRFESVHPRVIVDGAHNEMGAKTLVQTLKGVFKDGKLDLLLGMKDGKNVEDVIRIFKDSQCFRHIYVVNLTIQKSVPKELIIEKLQMNTDDVTMVEDLEPFLKGYLDKEDGILIGAGSLYLVSEIRSCMLLKEDNDDQL